MPRTLNRIHFEKLGVELVTFGKSKLSSCNESRATSAQKNSFFITFKPDSETPKGMPIESITALVHKLANGEQVVEQWRFANRKDVSLGDRVFLLLQGYLVPTHQIERKHLDGNTFGIQK